MSPSDVRDWRALDLGALPSFSRREAAASNAFRHVLNGGAGWQAWIAEGLSDFFESPAGFEIQLRQRHTTDPQHPEAVFRSKAGEISMGRDESCDIRLAQRSVGNRHARLFMDAGKCYLEDLGSALGTFLNESRLAANKPTLIGSGDRFAIFPFTFTIEITEKWVHDAPPEVGEGSVSVVDRSGPTSMDNVALAIRVLPVGASFCIETSRAFLEKLSAHLLVPLCPAARRRLGLTPVDTGFFELLIAAVLERINRDLPFPLQAELMCGGSAGLRGETGCLAFSFAIRVAEITGRFRLLMTDEAMELAGRSANPRSHTILPEVSWAFPLSAGYVDLTCAEIAAIEPADIVLLTREATLLFPNAPERGWRLLNSADNFSCATIDKYFERGCLSQKESKLEAGMAPDLTGLPIRMQAIIGEMEMTLAQANLLVPGAIVELDRTKSDPVQIALNGKISGHGELVEVEGRLGVRILSWRSP